jgi:hypothetical protein
MFCFIRYVAKNTHTFCGLIIFFITNIVKNKLPEFYCDYCSKETIPVKEQRAGSGGVCYSCLLFAVACVPAVVGGHVVAVILAVAYFCRHCCFRHC